jgi:hypothetical protein
VISLAALPTVPAVIAQLPVPAASASTSTLQSTRSAVLLRIAIAISWLRFSTRGSTTSQ